MITHGEGDLQKGFANPPLWDGSFDALDASIIDSLSQCVKKPKQCGELKWELKKKEGDDDNDHGEQWMENPPIYNKVLC